VKQLVTAELYNELKLESIAIKIKDWVKQLVTAELYNMGETTCHCRVVQRVETRVYCHKDKRFALDPIAAFVAVLSHTGPTGVQ
jgi:hypothetical protein